MMMEENAKVRATIYLFALKIPLFFKPKISIQAPLFNM
jgi:hypothetical protein